MTSRDKKHDWLRAKEIPYALTLIVGTLGWCAVHLIDEVQSSPTLAYCRSATMQDGKKKVTFRVTNISRKQLFRRASFYITASNTNINWKDYVGYQMEPEPPAKVVPDDNTPPSPEERLVRFYVAQFHPGASWNFSILLPPEKATDVALSADFSTPDRLSGVTVEPVALRLVPGNLETFLVLHQVGFLISMIIVWLVLAIVYVIKVPSL